MLIIIFDLIIAESELVGAIIINLFKTRLPRTFNIFSLFPKTIRVWNSLPTDIVKSNSLEIFKSELLSYSID